MKKKLRSVGGMTKQLMQLHARLEKLHGGELLDRVWMGSGIDAGDAFVRMRCCEMENAGLAESVALNEVLSDSIAYWQSCCGFRTVLEVGGRGETIDE